MLALQEKNCTILPAELDVQSKSVYKLLKTVPISSNRGTELRVGVDPILRSL